MTITLTREEAQQLLEVFELFLEEAEDVTTLENNLVKMLRTRLAQPEPEPVAWQPIDTAPKGKIVLVHYKNRLGNGRTMRARYYLPETLESDESESGWADEGWYEESEAYEYLMPLEGEPTHWMPLPPAPDAAPPQREWQGLTHEEVLHIKWSSAQDSKNTGRFEYFFARAIEAKLKEKNAPDL
jgi:hypothetical protein